MVFGTATAEAGTPFFGHATAPPDFRKTDR